MSSAIFPANFPTLVPPNFCTTQPRELSFFLRGVGCVPLGMTGRAAIVQKAVAEVIELFGEEGSDERVTLEKVVFCSQAKPDSLK
jgi:hypothetical protein